MARCIPVDRDTDYLLPPSVEEWLPADHLARFVVEVVAGLDLGELSRQYAGRGWAAPHPSVLLALLIYGYATGVHSSRKLERATYDSVAFRYVAANTHPDHDTLATFRHRFRVEFEHLFVQVLVLAREMKVLKLAESADQKSVPDGMDLPAEIARRQGRLAAIAKAQAQIERRARERHEEEQRAGGCGHADDAGRDPACDPGGE